MAAMVFTARAASSGTNQLVWRAGINRVDAQIGSWNLRQLLAQISTQTGWQVYVEPGVEQNVSVKFQNLEVREALSRLLGDLNYALLPQKLGKAKLFIYHDSVQNATPVGSSLGEQRRERKR